MKKKPRGRNIYPHTKDIYTMNNNKWTETNQRAEFLGGAIAGGCALIFMIGIAVLLISAFVFCGNGC